MVLSREEALANHRRMWRRIAERTRAEKRCVGKREVIEELWGDIDIGLDCWCCEYCDRRCEKCPVVWGGDETCGCMDTEYSNWLDASDDDWNRAAKIAERIANLPERKNARRR